ncbi:hypothetical protein RMATCC62417_01481 [Rhizopus microsporus]|nr:hypothetical protein RMATCC62417_01481 [Rhizopus microsporus]
MNIIAPCPQKPSRYNYYAIGDQADEACQELRQILASSNKMVEELSIARTNNPMPNDTSFIIPNVQQSNVNEDRHRPRSFSMGDTRAHFISQAKFVVSNLAY